MLAIKIIMPSQGDMSLIDQENGTITLRPMFFGGECAGPHVQVVDVEKKDGKFTVKSIKDNYRLRIKADGKIEIRKGQTAEEDQ